MKFFLVAIALSFMFGLACQAGQMILQSAMKGARDRHVGCASLIVQTWAGHEEAEIRREFGRPNSVSKGYLGKESGTYLKYSFDGLMFFIRDSDGRVGKVIPLNKTAN